MIRYLVFLAFTFGLAISATAQDTELRSLDAFNEIKVATGIEATIVEGTTNQIEITANGIELDEILSSVKGGHLVVRLKTSLNLWEEGRLDVQAIITYNQELAGIIANSGASIDSDNKVTSENIEIKASSGATLDLDIMCGDVKATVSTGAEMDLKGEARRLDLKFNTGSTFRGFDLQTQKARVKGGTGAEAQITVHEYIQTKVNTGATIEYKGNPSKQDINKGTGGEVRQRS